MPGGIGILGGTFDPIHLGHLRAAIEVREVEGLDEVRLVPAAVPPHKEIEGITDPVHRLRMTELAVTDTPGLRAWDIELGRSGPSYTVDTIRSLRARVGPTTRVALLLGRDAFEEFHTWREPETVLSLCDLVVMTRPPRDATPAIDELRIAAHTDFRYDASSGSIRHASGRAVSVQRITALDISSTAIRALVSARRSIRFLVPPAVEQYIAAHGLYSGRQDPHSFAGAPSS